MKKRVRINFNVDDFANPRDLDEIVQLYPAGVRYGQFSWGTEAENPILNQILEKLHAKCFVPWVNVQRNRLRNEYSIDYQVTFESSDLKSERYLFIDPSHSLDDACAQFQDGEIHLQTERLEEVDRPTRDRLLAGALPLAIAGPGLVVSNAFRKAIEDAHLVGIKFVDKFWVTGPDASRIPEGFWIMESDLIAPPPSKHVKKVDAEGNSIEADDLTNCRRAPGEMYKYDESALAARGDFDCAVMWELREKDLKFYVVSQRFYRLCRRRR